MVQGTSSSKSRMIDSDDVDVVFIRCADMS